MPEETHPGSWLGDLSNEWKHAKTPEKVIIVGAIAATVGIALYLHKQSTSAPNQPGAANSSGLGGIPANFIPSATGGGTGGIPGGGGGGGGTPTPTPTPSSPLKIIGTFQGNGGRLWGVLAPGQSIPSGVAVDQGHVLLTGTPTPGAQVGNSLANLGIGYQIQQSPTLPVRPIIQPTTVLSTYGSTNHAPSAPKPPIGINVTTVTSPGWIKTTQQTWQPPPGYHANAPGAAGPQRGAIPAPQPAPSNTMQQTVNRLLNLNR